MALEIRPDPRYRLGGHAIISIEAAAAESTHVTLRRPEDGSYLGPHGWQGSEHRFGPYPVSVESRHGEVQIGPEIVNQVEPYVAVQLSLVELGVKETLAWPDEVLPAPESHRGGGVQASRPESSLKAQTAAGQSTSEEEDASPGDGAEDPVGKPPTGEETAPAGSAPAPAVDTARPGSRRVWWSVAGVLIAALIVAGAWYMHPEPLGFLGFPPQTEEGGTNGPPPAPETVLACTEQDIGTVIGSGTARVEDIKQVLRRCPDNPEDPAPQVDLCEALMAQGDPACLMRYGEWYDPQRGEESPFGKDATIAVRYYREAVDAEIEGARERLEQICSFLSERSGQLARNAVATYCDS